MAKSPTFFPQFRVFCGVKKASPIMRKPSVFPLLVQALAYFVFAVLLTPLPEVQGAESWEQTAHLFFRAHCLECHSGEEPEAKLNLEELSSNLSDGKAFRIWVKIHDKLQSGEMPPAGLPQPKGPEREKVLTALAKSLHSQNAAEKAKQGRVQFRRLNRSESENTLSMLQRMGIETDRFASSTGTLRGLELA